MCNSQTDQNIAQIILLLDDLLKFYQAFGMNLSFNKCGIFVAGGAMRIYLDTAPLQGHIR